MVKGYQKKGLRLLFRGDAAFAKPELYEYLEEEKTGYAIRLPANQVVQEQIQPLLEPPTEWPSREPMVSYHDFAYQAQSWRLPRRVVAKVEWHRGELFPRVGFIVTNLSYPPKGIVRFYNGRGTAEQWIKEGKYALNWTRLSCHKFVANQVRLALFVLAYNLGNFLRRLALPESMKHWSLTSLQTRLIKTGGRLVRHARRLVMLWIEPINEIKLVALVVLLAAALLTGPVAGLALGWRHGRLGRLAGSALGLGVGVLSVMVVAVMMYEADQAEMVLIGPAADQAEMVLIGPAAFAEAGDLAPVAIGGEVRYALPVSGTEATGAHHGPLYGRMTLTWALLYPIRVGAAILCTWFATTLLWSLGRMGARFVVRSR